jgi:hypothetical protein
MHELWKDEALAAVVGGLAKPRLRPIWVGTGPASVPMPLFGDNPPSGYIKGQAIPVDKLKDPAQTDFKPNVVKFRVRPFKPFAALFTRGLQIPTSMLSAPAGAAVPEKYFLTPAS